MSTPVALTINVREANTTLPADLSTRLTGTPKSPEELAEEIKAHMARTEFLRNAHLDAIKDRAARDSERAKEAIARKLRMQAHHAAKVQKKLDEATAKTTNKKMADEKERETRKARREELAQAVVEARKTATEARTRRQAELLEAEKSASSKHARSVSEVQTKGACAAKHALDVVVAHKEKTAQEALAKAEALASRLGAAESRRQAATPTTGPRSRAASPPLHRVRNEGKVLCEMRRINLEASLAKAADKREAHIASVQGKARAENAKAAEVVAKLKSIATGTDAATAEAKAAMYDRLVHAEVARLSALKTKHSKGEAAKSNQRVIVVRVDEMLTIRAPPPSLTKRLSTKGTTLLATAASRQAGAAASRKLRLHALLTKLAGATVRRAAAHTRVSKAAALVASEVAAKAARSLVTHALAQGARVAAVAVEAKRRAAVEAKRAQLANGIELVGKACAARHVAAAERRVKSLSAVAKPGVVAARHAAFTARRAALSDAVLAAAAAKTSRCTIAEANRTAVLAARVERARKYQVAKHPKREVADASFSDA